ncbi:MAG TPA: Ig-like domain-containing protein [Candidatus Limnocylindria bacterium]|nr:Ig-like domain-containing protein [Candidatus Limnocylindria bacterium]
MRATQPSVYARLQQHRAITRLTLAGLALAVALGFSLQDAVAGPNRDPLAASTILPANIGVGVATTDAVVVTFTEPMDPASVEASLALKPAAEMRTSWSTDRRTLTLRPGARWQTDRRYLVTIDASARLAKGGTLGEDKALSFTTQTAPSVSEFEVRLVSDRSRPQVTIRQPGGAIAFDIADGAVLGDTPLIDSPVDTLDDASSQTGIRIAFTAPMNEAEVESRFSITPTVRGDFSWRDNQVTFTPRDRLKPDTRYAISLVGAHDAVGNRLGGDVSFSFTTRAEAELVRVTPKRHATNVRAKQVVLRFSEPMNLTATANAIKVRNLTTGRRVGGRVDWRDGGTELRYVFKSALPRGSVIEVNLGKASKDKDGNAVSVSWTFRTRPAPAGATQQVTQTRIAPARPGPAAPADMQEFALWQINQARADYGFAPLRLDGAVSAVASAHAWDMLNNGYFSHTGRDGSTIAGRLRAGGVNFSWSGENICYYNGLGLRGTLEWCHATFMSEPYPGVANHIGNILSPHYNRLGVGIATSGGKVIVVWDFAG